MTAPDRVESAALGAIGYRKPAAVLLALRNHVLDPATFDRAMREYVRRWAFKHPTPGDFFRTVENVSGQELGWFWRSFWYTTDVLDIGVEGATTRTANGETIATVALRRHTSVPFPPALRLKLADGSTRDVRAPVDLWARPAAGDRVEVSVVVPAAVTGVRLWPAGTVPDFNPANDTWGDAPAGDPPGPSTQPPASR
jgi:aminopeptidase N